MKNYWDILKKELHQEAQYVYSNQPGLSNQFIISADDNHLLLFTTGYHQHVYQHFLVYHFEKRNGRIWLHENNTDSELIERFRALGIPENVFYVPFLEEAIPNLV